MASLADGAILLCTGKAALAVDEVVPEALGQGFQCRRSILGHVLGHGEGHKSQGNDAPESHGHRQVGGARKRRRGKDLLRNRKWLVTFGFLQEHHGPEAKTLSNNNYINNNNKNNIVYDNNNNINNINKNNIIILTIIIRTIIIMIHV